MKTSTAEKHNFVCPICGDKLGQDPSGKGYVRHLSNPKCQFEKGQKDLPASPTGFTSGGTLSEPLKLPDSFAVCGYSERGAFNALLHEISYSHKANELMIRLLNSVRTPHGAMQYKAIDGANILLEPSLSDFGDADAIVLLHSAGERCAVFFEGKVKSSQHPSWMLNDEWTKFFTGICGQLNSSNLFTQLYHKVRFVCALRNAGITGLQQGIEFPACSSKTVRKIGSNPVVLRATQLISEYLDRVQYVAIVPDNPQRVQAFFEDVLPTQNPQKLPGWDTFGWGYLCWSEVEEFCRENGLVNSVRVFEFNRGQIY